MHTTQLIEVGGSGHGLDILQGVSSLPVHTALLSIYYELVNLDEKPCTSVMHR